MFSQTPTELMIAMREIRKMREGAIFVKGQPEPPERIDDRAAAVSSPPTAALGARSLGGRLLRRTALARRFS